jgi:hypothetical protein
MRLTKYFKLFESRTSELSEEEFFKIMKESCKDFINNPKYLQRVKNKFERTYSYIDPKIHNRTEGTDRNMAKNLLFLLDNLPAWKDYPKRNNSIIATSGHTKSIYGRDYFIIIPFDGAKFGVVPDDDLWGCRFKVGENKSVCFGTLQSSMDDNKVLNSSYDVMIKDIQHLYDNYEESVFLLNWSKELGQFFDYIKSLGYENVEQAFIDLLTPDRLVGLYSKPFRISNYNDLKSDSAEVWTDSKCLIYHLGHLAERNWEDQGTSSQELFNSFLEKIKKYNE